MIFLIALGILKQQSNAIVENMNHGYWVIYMIKNIIYFAFQVAKLYSSKARSGDRWITEDIVMDESSSGDFLTVGS